MELRFTPAVMAALLAATAISFAAEPATRRAAPPAVNDAAPPLKLDGVDGKPVDLAELRKAGPVVVLQLRGWVGYQCPICNKQVGAFVARAADFETLHAQIVMVYPGPADGLKAHAAEFATGKTLPANVHLMLDPDLKAADAWGLRWAKAGETAYPSTFAVDTAGVVRFAKVSHSHGGRATPQQVLDVLAKGK